MTGTDGRATVAVIGTGIMGAAMARNLAAAGLNTRVWDRSASAAGPLDAPIADAKFRKMDQRDFTAELPLEWALKDVDLAISATPGDTPPLLAALSGQWHAAVAAGHSREDISAARLALDHPARG
jgi:3-hydroxyisobutyrate dehydrogenase-like beta-hydroxyacid dehydrogenase